MSDGDIVELKHALGTVIAENDILQAKLRNANTDINEKMRKTGDVLNDSRAHLSKAQAENMELRTQLEKERNRNETLEARIVCLHIVVSNTYCVVFLLCFFVILLK
jgi:ABC-type transporter Mla subunit MlaD